MERWLIPHLEQWLTVPNVDNTNNRIERFNKHLKRDVLRGISYKKGFCHFFGDLNLILLILLLSFVF